MEISNQFARVGISEEEILLKSTEDSSIARVNSSAFVVDGFMPLLRAYSESFRHRMYHRHSVILNVFVFFHI